MRRQQRGSHLLERQLTKDAAPDGKRGGVEKCKDASVLRDQHVHANAAARSIVCIQGQGQVAMSAQLP